MSLPQPASVTRPVAEQSFHAGQCFVFGTINAQETRGFE
jgi:hypothetical protein